MTVERLTTSFFESTNTRLGNSSQLKAFNLLRDREDNEKFLNIWRAFTLSNEAENKLVYYDLHEISEGDWWDNISVKYYDTPSLWWTIAIINKLENPFESLIPGNFLKILKQEYLYQLLKEIKGVSIL